MRCIAYLVFLSCFQEAHDLLKDRTLNRHRWTGRKDPGAGENDAKGTRQIGPVTSGEGVPKEVNLLLEVALKRGGRLFSKNTGLC
jgi:hypothetical protein